MAISKTLLAGLQASYDALASKDSNVLYFCTDTMNMYKGSDLYTDGIRTVAAYPTTPAIGKIYNITGTQTLEIYDGSSWSVIRPQISTALSSSSTNDQLITAKGVYDYITSTLESLTGSGSVVQGVEASTTEGAISVTTGGTTADVVVHGVVTTPSYDSSTRTITLPVSDGTTVKIELGKDIFVDTTADNKYNSETGNIELYLNDGTKIEVPASALVDTYTGGSSTSAKVSVSDSNVITATVTLSSDTNNAITVDATNGGLLVDLSAYATTSDLTTLESSLTTKIETAQSTADNATTAAQKAQDTADAAQTAATAAQTTADSAASAASAAQTTANTALTNAATAQDTADSAATAAATAQTTADNAATAAATAQSTADAAKTAAATAQTTADTALTNAATAQSTADAAKTAAATAQSTADAAVEDAAAAQTTADNAVTAAATAQSTADAAKTSAATNAANISTLQDDVAEIQDALEWGSF